MLRRGEVLLTGGEFGEVIVTRALMRVRGELKYVRQEQRELKGGYIIYYINMKLS